jgi:hypothetical protein
LKNHRGTALNSQKEKKMISAKVICDSKSPQGVRITTMELEYPRIIHSEFMTHRVFSRNAASSRAIPVAKMLERVRLNPAMPVSWGKNQAGMQAGEEHNALICVPSLHPPEENYGREQLWSMAASDAAAYSEAFAQAGYHKQVANRLTEPFQWMRTLVTSTEWDNFFDLRDHPDADPTFQALAAAMREAMKGSAPVEREYHLPYITEEEFSLYQMHVIFKVSANRCKRVSYFNFGGAQVPIADEVAGFNEMAGGKPLHASPLEHPAVAMCDDEYSGNFRGWHQFRQAWEGRKSYRKSYAFDLSLARRRLMVGDSK